MKKYFIIAAAAIVAMAACSKVEDNFDLTSPNNKIGFEVAKYTRQIQTKANAITDEAIYSFHTLANQFPTVGSPVVFMDVDILPWHVENSTRTQVTAPAANETLPLINVWAPSDDYYWPKTGWINFYSYAGTHTPTVGNAAADKKTVTFTYTDAVINANSNILVADAALHYARTNSETETYDVDNSETSGHVTKGVPTIFRHQLAKLIIDVEARTTDAKISTNTTWKVQVLSVSADNADYKSEIKPINKGSLLLTSAEAANTTTNTYAWAKTNESATNISGWVASDVATDKEAIALSDSDVLEIPVNTTGNGAKSVILAERSVLPQLTNNVDFKLTYKVQALHGNTVFMEETREVGVTAAKTISQLANTVTSWSANQRITYHVIIDPVSEKVTFDPAVEEYVDVDADDTQDIININENGLVNP